MVYTIVWLGWGVAFCVIEGFALLDPHPGGTLSENVWRLFRVKDRRPRPLVLILHAVLLAFMVWLSGHLVFGWWPT